MAVTEYVPQVVGDETLTRVRGKILDRIGDFPGERVFYIDRSSKGDFVLTEACDEYFGTRLSAAELRQLGEELIAAAESK